MTGVLLAAPPSYCRVGECFLPDTASRSEPQHATGWIAGSAGTSR